MKVHVVYVVRHGKGTAATFSNAEDAEIYASGERKQPGTSVVDVHHCPVVTVRKKKAA